ncbi:DUF2586 family protein [Ferruginibacter yonginensis]|uniref:DUF2586 family protein n=1 Tax=Ferruginibacter yonginensis TaxID=1310416 RepID=A0ABV8QQB3_9BACT
MNGISFNREQGQLGRKAAGEDHVSLLSFYNMELAASNPSLDCTSLPQAITQGLSTTDSMFYYHVAEFFRTAPGARLITAVYQNPSTDYSEIKAKVIESAGVVKQVGIWNGSQAVSYAKIEALNAICEELAALNMPVFSIESPMVDEEDYATLLDLSTVDCPFVSVVIAQDNAGFGVNSTENVQTGIIGAALGALARSQVHTSIAWVERQNMVTDFIKNPVTNQFHPSRELDNLGFLGGTNYSEFTPAQIDALDAKGYIFLRKHVSLAGSYFNHSRTATSVTSDYAFIENTRTMNKVQRAVYAQLLPKLSAPAYIDRNTGFLQADSVAGLEAIAEQGLAQMERDGELSGYAVQIDPEQSILSTSKLQTKVRAVPVGVLREYEVSLGFTLKINQ